MGHQQGRGERAETMALRVLERKGWVLLNRNWKCRWGELDLVLRKGEQLLVVEVKGRSSGHRDRNGLDAFHSRKRQRLAKAISCWRERHPTSAQLLLQVALVLVPLAQPESEMRWIHVDRLG